MVSHHRQPSVHPTTLTPVPAGSQATKGKFRSGPARMLTACVVMALNCADALNGDKVAAASSNGHNQRLHGTMGHLKKGFWRFFLVMSFRDLPSVDCSGVKSNTRWFGRRLPAPFSNLAPV